MQPPTIFTVKKRAIVAWCIYDWGISSFSAVITTFVFATYFTKVVAVNKIAGTIQWGHAIALAGLIIALCSPLFGAIADHEGRRKPWIGFFTILAIVSAGLLWFTKPASAYVPWALTWVVMGSIGLEVAMVFYNAMMRDLAPKNYLGRISGWAWGLGYVGGLTLLSITLFGFIENGFGLNLDHSQSENIRICGPLVAIWLGLFSLPLFFLTPDRPSTHIPIKTAIFRGLSTLFLTLRKLREHQSVVRFLIAEMIYIDGLNTLFAFGGIYAAGTFGMSMSEVLKFGITINITAGLGAGLFAWVDDYIGAKKTILISLGVMVISGAALLLIHSKFWFWIFALFFGLFVGPVQAASRSLMSRIAPAEIVTEMFGLYAFAGKATAFVGPWILALLTSMFDSQRAGMTVVMVFLFTGGLILMSVKEVR